MNKLKSSFGGKRWPQLARGHLLPFLALICTALAALPALSAELIMYETPGCMWCRQWHAEVGLGYAKTVEGQRAPLRRRMLADPPLPGLLLASAVTVTPTFVLAEHSKEVGRIAGYPGSEFFYPLLNDLFKRLPDALPAQPAALDKLKTTNQ